MGAALLATWCETSRLLGMIFIFSRARWTAGFALADCPGSLNLDLLEYPYGFFTLTVTHSHRPGIFHSSAVLNLVCPPPHSRPLMQFLGHSEMEVKGFGVRLCRAVSE